MILLPYARVSERGSSWHDQGIESSVPAQLDEIRRWVGTRHAGAELLPPAVDEFATAKADSLWSRPAMGEVVAELEGRRASWDSIVTLDMDRVTRSMDDATRLLRLLADAGKGIIAIRQQWDYSTPLGRLLLLQTVAFSEYWRSQIASKTRDKMLAIARDGGWPVGRAPLGYRRGEKHDNVLKVDPRAAERLREAFRRYAAGESAAEAGRAVGIAEKSLLNSYLRNPVYIGRIRYAEYEGPGKHEAIIDRETWDRVQSRLPGTRKAPRPTAQAYDYLLAGRVWCACGRSLRPHGAHGAHGGRYAYYRCGGRHPGEKTPSVRADALEQAVTERLRRLLETGPQLEREARRVARRIREQAGTAEGELRSIAQAEVEARQERDGLAGAFARGVVTAENMAFFNDRLRELSGELARLEARRETLAKASGAQALPSADDLLRDVRHWLRVIVAGSDWRAVVRAAVVRVDWLGPGRFELATVLGGGLSSGQSWHPIREQVKLRARVTVR